MNTIPQTDTQGEATMFDLTPSFSFDLTPSFSFKDIGRWVFETLGLAMPETDTLDASASDSDSSSTTAFLAARERTKRAIQETETGIEGKMHFDTFEAYNDWRAGL